MIWLCGVGKCLFAVCLCNEWLIKLAANKCSVTLFSMNLIKRTFSTPEVIECISLPAGIIASSFKAELHAILTRLNWLVCHVND